MATPFKPSSSEPRPALRGTPESFTKEQTKEDSFRFGDRGDFWAQYCEVADKFDEDSLEKLNNNLGDLLIFAGLFSAVNSAFIVLTLGSLITDPVDETNQLLRILIAHFDNTTLSGLDNSSTLALRPSLVRQNCLFFASLALSLLAATGAVLAKQWIETYKRTGQKGTHSEQGLRRTEKFFGAEHWKFRQVIEALPTGLLISLALFFVALCDYLWSINRHVAITVTAFASAGAFFYLFTTIVAAIFTRCPFQTALSSSIRRLFEVPKPKPYSPEATVQLSPAATLLKFLRQPFRTDHVVGTPPPSHQLFVLDEDTEFSTTSNSAQSHDDMLSARSAVWMIEIAPENRDNLLVVAKNLPALLDRDAVRFFSSSSACLPIIERFQSTLVALQIKGHGSAEKAEVYARAVIQILLADVNAWDKTVMRAFTKSRDLDWVNSHRWLFESAPDLVVTCLYIVHLSFQTGHRYRHKDFFSLSHPFVEHVNGGLIGRNAFWRFTPITFLEQFILYERVALAMANDPQIKTEKVLQASLRRAEWLGGLLAKTSIPSTNMLLSLTSLALVPVLQRLSTDRKSTEWIHDWDKRLERTWLSRDDKLGNILTNVERLLEAYQEYFRSVLLDPELPLHTDLLQCQRESLLRVRRLYPSWRPFYDNQPPETVNGVAAMVLANLRSTLSLLDSYGPRGARSALRSAEEVGQDVAALRSCKTGLLYHLKCLTNRAHREVEIVDKPSSDGMARETTEDERTVSMTLDMFAKLEPRAGGTASSTALVPSPSDLQLLPRALAVDSLISMDITKELIRAVLFTSTNTSYPQVYLERITIPHLYFLRFTNSSDTPGRPTHHQVHEINHTNSGTFHSAPAIKSLMRLFQGRLDKGVDPSQLDWWVAVWLVGTFQNDRSLTQHVGQAEAVTLFLAARRRLAEIVRAAPGIDHPIKEWIVCLGALFLELWGSAESRARDSSWMGDDIFKAFAAYLDAIDGRKTIILEEEGSSRGLFPIASRRYKVVINYEHTFHFMEHAFKYHSAAAEQLREVSRPLIYSLVRNLSPRAREIAKRARSAYEQPAPLLRAGQPPPAVAAVAGYCETCATNPTMHQQAEKKAGSDEKTSNEAANAQELMYQGAGADAAVEGSSNGEASEKS